MNGAEATKAVRGIVTAVATKKMTAEPLGVTEPRREVEEEKKNKQTNKPNYGERDVERG